MLVKNTFTHDARVMREATTLLAAGHEIHVVALGTTGLPQSEIREGIHIHRTERPGDSLRRLGDPHTVTPHSTSMVQGARRLLLQMARRAYRWRIFSFISSHLDQRIFETALEINPDAIHAHDLDTLAVGVRLAQTCAVPLVYDSHEMATGRNLHSRAAQRAARKLEGSLIQFPEVIITASPGYSQRIADLYQVPMPLVLRNVPELTSNFHSSMNLRKRFSIPDYHTVLVHQGTILPHRGCEQIIEAMGHLDNCELVIIGFGAHVLVLQALVERMGLERRVHFLGAVPPQDLISWAHSADIGFCTIVGASDSYRESMPNKLFEYVMSEIAVIASDYPGMGGFVTTNDIGVVCDPASPTDIVRAVRAITTDSRALGRYKGNSRALKESVNWEHEAHVLINAYRALNR